MSSYVLILSVITSYGGVTTQRQTGFASYESCAEHAVAWADPQRPLHPDSHLLGRMTPGLSDWLPGAIIA
jgi:hypothetical protein